MRVLLAAAFALAFATPAFALDPTEPLRAAAPYLVVLGIAQDGGVPQAGSTKEPGWQDPAKRRLATSLAIVDDAHQQRWLFEATPNFPEQLQRLDALAPREGKPALSGIFLTHAHMGHYTGLMWLGKEVMGASAVPVYAMPRMAGYLRTNGPWSQLVKLSNISLRELEVGVPVQLGPDLRVIPIIVPHRQEFSEVVGFRIEAPSAKVLFIPDIDSWEQWDEAGTRIEDEIAKVDVAYLDATFFANGEIPGRDMSGFPHPFIRHSIERFAALPAKEKEKIRFIHLNHTNQALWAGTAERRELEAAGFRVAEEGERIELGCFAGAMSAVRGPARRMDVKSGYPFWAIKNGLLHDFPRLPSDLRCEVTVLGAGLTGALIADELARHGHDVLVLDACDVGWGSTAATTALLQYEIDIHLVDLAKRIGEADAVLAYRACADAIPALHALAKRVGDVGFECNDSLYFASRAGHVERLREECRLRAAHGLPARWLGREALRARYGLAAPGAILSSLGARLDPYRLTHRLLRRLERAGTRVFDHTPVVKIETGSRGVAVHTDEGLVVRSRHLVVAAGYSSQQWLRQRVASNRSTYAVVTDPIAPDELGVWKSTLLWESARPYLYLRATADGRLMVGGEDDAIDVPARRDARVEPKTRKLLARIARMFPQIELKPAFAWAGTFAETADGLPFFGPHPERGPRVHFAMAYGGNGITYAVLGASVLRARIERRAHPLARLFAFDRLQR